MDIRILDHDGVLDILPDRKPWSHKGDYGKLLLLCGSRGFTGAAELASKGALRSGAGLVYLAVPESIYPIMAGKLTEAIVVPVADGQGMYALTAFADISKLLAKADTVLLGPGLGQSEGVRSVVKTVLECFPGPIVLDADGINVLQGETELLRSRSGPTVLTPHDVEFTRLGGVLTGERRESAADLARRLGCTVLLKGHRTVITDGSCCYENRTGNPGMAVGGSGDLLAGILTGLIGQGIPPLEAAACAAWLHGRAGDLCAEQIGQYGMLPSDMLTVLPGLLK